jgi:hypothetical protein
MKARVLLPKRSNLIHVRPYTHSKTGREMIDSDGANWVKYEEDDVKN